MSLLQHTQHTMSFLIVLPSLFSSGIIVAVPILLLCEARDEEYAKATATIRRNDTKCRELFWNYVKRITTAEQLYTESLAFPDDVLLYFLIVLRRMRLIAGPVFAPGTIKLRFTYWTSILITIMRLEEHRNLLLASFLLKHHKNYRFPSTAG